MSNNESALIIEKESRALITELCRQFYQLGWVTGTGGGIALRDRENKRFFIAPSGVQKERIGTADIFVMDEEQQVLKPPHNDCLRPSACTPLFFNAFGMRDAGACIHTHDMWAMLVTLCFDKEFRISKQEMIKGIDGLGYEDELIVPIIENTADERDLKDSMALAMKNYPSATAVLVRSHGLYVWGKTWQSAKTQCECYSYLFEASMKMRQFGIEPAANNKK